MADTRKRAGFTVYILGGICLVIVAYLGRGFYYRAITIHELLTENKHLKQAITNLTYEDQIGYAKVIAQEPNDGKILTTIKFIETARDNKLKTVLEKEYTIEGDGYGRQDKSAIFVEKGVQRKNGTGPGLCDRRAGSGTTKIR